MRSTESTDRRRRGRSRHSRTSVALSFVAAAAIVVAVVAAPVAAHAYLSESDPANGEQVETLPAEVTLYFSGDGIQVADVSVVGPDDEDVSGEAAIDPDDAKIVHVPIEGAAGSGEPDAQGSGEPGAEGSDATGQAGAEVTDATGQASAEGTDERGQADAEGVYIVHWEVLSNDGHTTSGTFFFSVGDEPLDRDAILGVYESDDGERVSPVETGAKALLLVAVVALVGVPVTARLVVYPAVGRAETSAAVVDRRLARLLAAACGLLLAAVLALGIARSASLEGYSIASVAQYVGTPLGRIWLLQVALAAAVATALAVTVRGRLPRSTRPASAIRSNGSRPSGDADSRSPSATGSRSSGDGSRSGVRAPVRSRRAWLASSFVGGALVLATVSWSSHSATAVDRALGMAVDVGHLAGAGVWVGGLLVLAVVVPAALRETDPGERASVAAGVIRRFSLVAIAGVTLAAGSGLLLAAWHAPTVEGIAGTLYGIALSTKTLLVLVALGLAGFTRFLLLGRLELGSEVGGIRGWLFARWADAERPLLGDGGETGTIAAFVRTVRIEVAVVLLVVVISGVLTTAPTAAVAGVDDGPRGATLERDVGDLRLELSATPAEHRDDGLVIREGEPLVLEVAVESAGERVRSDRTVRLLANNDRHDSTLEIDLEETAQGTYTTVQALPDPDEWEFRLTGSFDGTYVSEWFDAYAEPADGSGDHEHHESAGLTGADTLLASLLRVGALAVGVAGSLAVAIESVRFGRRRARS